MLKIAVCDDERRAISIITGSVEKVILEYGVTARVETMEKETRGTNLVHFKEGQGTITLNAEKIAYIECYRNVQTVHVDGQEEVVRLYSRMETLEQELRPFHFLRIHKGYLVSCRYVKRFDGKSVSLITGETLPVGRQKRQAAMDEYMDFVRENGGYVG